MTQIPAYRKMGVRVVCGHPAYEYLVRDFADYEPIDVKGDGDRWLMNGKTGCFPKKIKEKYSCRRIVPDKSLCTKASRQYVTYGRYDKNLAYDVVFHARASKKYGQAKLNYKKLREVWKALGKPRAASIGTVADHVEGTDDLRNIPMERLCNLLRSSKVTVGTSSAPLHLSMLCKTPAVVITYDKWLKSIRGTNRHRYEKLWNPFKVKCTALDQHNWHPPVDLVAKAVKEYL